MSPFVLTKANRSASGCDHPKSDLGPAGLEPTNQTVTNRARSRDANLRRVYDENCNYFNKLLKLDELERWSQR
jgi:hypothetical protein